MKNKFTPEQKQMIDKELRNFKLSNLHKWLNRNIEGYVALSEAGSTTAGDPWVAGRSDRDITIVVEEITPSIERDVQKQLGRLEFNDTYLFLILSKPYFLTTHSDQDISVKFRGQTLFGEDVVALKEAPSQEFADKVGEQGFNGMSLKLKTRLLNAEYWSTERLGNYLYPEFKKLLMYLADKHYGATGEYPRRRVDVAEAYDSDQLRQISTNLARFNQLGKEELIETARVAIDYLNNHTKVND